jgi:hypothetical protein
MCWRLLLVLFAGVVLGGCTTWVKPGATDYDRERDSNACEVESYNHYPPRLRQVLVEPAHWEPFTEDCYTDKKGRRHCTRSGGYFVPNRYGTADENDGPRRAVYEACMYKYGWQKE